MRQPPQLFGSAAMFIVASMHDAAAFSANFVRKGNQTRELAVDRDVEAGIAFFVQSTAVERGSADLDIALAHEALASPEGQARETILAGLRPERRNGDRRSDKTPALAEARSCGG